MRRILRRTAAVALSIGLTAGPVAQCADMTATAAARMACCTDGDACPMHEGGSRGSGSHAADTHHQPTQSQADHCCTVSGRDGRGPSVPIYAGAASSAVLGATIVLPATVPSLVRTDSWRAAAPVPIAHVPRHVLLAVFLV